MTHAPVNFMHKTARGTAADCLAWAARLRLEARWAKAFRQYRYSARLLRSARQNLRTARQCCSQSPALPA